MLFSILTLAGWSATLLAFRRICNGRSTSMLRRVVGSTSMMVERHQLCETLHGGVPFNNLLQMVMTKQKSPSRVSLWNPLCRAMFSSLTIAFNSAALLVEWPRLMV